MDMDNGVGIDCGSGGWAGWRREKGENWDNCNRIIKYLIKNTLKKRETLSPWMNN